MTVQKIFKGELDEEVHADFLKFGRGEYKDKYLLEGKKQSKGWSIKTGPEFVNLIVEHCLKKLNGETEITGVIVSTTNLIDEVPFEVVKNSNFQGVRKLQIKTEVNPATILELLEKHPRAFFALSFKGDDFALKVKAKAPKSGKPGKNSDEGPKADFCTLKTTDNTLVEELFFDHPKFTEAKISHTILVEEIVYPANMNELKPAEVREQSKRKGKITRKAIIDGKETANEVEFVA